MQTCVCAPQVPKPHTRVPIMSKEDLIWRQGVLLPQFRRDFLDRARWARDAYYAALNPKEGLVDLLVNNLNAVNGSYASPPLFRGSDEDRWDNSVEFLVLFFGGVRF
jgi:hypothetical protein